MDPFRTPQNASEEIDVRIDSLVKRGEYATKERDRLRKQAESFERDRLECLHLEREWRDIRKALYGDH